MDVQLILQPWVVPTSEQKQELITACVLGKDAVSSSSLCFPAFLVSVCVCVKDVLN